MKAHRLSNEEVARELDFRKGEMVRRYRKGQAKPETRERMEKLATLMGMSPEELEWGKKPLPGVARVPIIDVSPEEQALIDIYRQLSPTARKLVRARASELLERFGAPTAENPFGKGVRSRGSS